MVLYRIDIWLKISFCALIVLLWQPNAKCQDNKPKSEQVLSYQRDSNTIVDKVGKAREIYQKDPDKADQLVREASALAEILNCEGCKAHITLAKADHLYSQRNYQEAGILYRQALASLRSVMDPELKGKAFFYLAWTEEYDNDLQNASVHLDSALTYLSLLGNTPVLSHALNLKATIEIDNADYSEALKTLDEHQNIFDEASNLKTYTSPHYQLSRLYMRVGKLDSALYHIALENALDRKYHGVSRQANSLKMWGVIHKNKGEYDQALEKYLKGINLLDTEKHASTLLGLKINLGNVYSEKGDTEEAIELWKEILPMADQIGSATRRAMINENMSKDLMTEGQVEEARRYAKQALVINTQGQDIEGQLASYDLLYQLAKTDSDDNNVLMYSQHYLELAEAKNVKNKLAYAYYLRGQALNKTAQLALAEEHLLTSYRIARRYGYNAEALRALHAILPMNSKLKNYEEGLSNAMAYIVLKDSMENVRIQSNIEDLLLKYQTSEKERTIALQELEIQKQKNQRNSLLGSLFTIVCVGGLLLFLLWNRNRLNRRLLARESQIQKQKIEQLENEKKLLAMSSMIEGQEAERQRIARDLHDGIGGLLSTVKAHFGAIQDEIKRLETFNVYDKVNDLIDTASAEVRRISHNMAPQALSLSGLKDALQDLCDQHQTDYLQIRFQWIGSIERFDQNTEIMLYRVVQELINNTVKHAHAQNLLIQVNRHDEELNLIVEDDGQGFDFEKALESKGLGLKSVQSRIQYLKGSLDVDSFAGEGTTFGIQISI